MLMDGTSMDVSDHLEYVVCFFPAQFDWALNHQGDSSLSSMISSHHSCIPKSARQAMLKRKDQTPKNHGSDGLKFVQKSWKCIHMARVCTVRKQPQHNFTLTGFMYGSSQWGLEVGFAILINESRVIRQVDVGNLRLVTWWTKKRWIFRQRYFPSWFIAFQFNNLGLRCIMTDKPQASWLEGQIQCHGVRNLQVNL
jgi:hypothetical protein